MAGYQRYEQLPTTSIEQRSNSPYRKPVAPFNVEQSLPLELTKLSFRQRWFGGLLFTLRTLAALSTCILIINVGWFAWAMSKYGAENGYGTIQEGDCAATKSLNTWLHLAINALSTGLLLSSTAFMQLVNSPSRNEIDTAHQQQKWLSIGLLSPRNFFGVSRKKAILCIILALSSLPFHLLYNSVIFASLSANDYYWAVVTEGFLTGDSFNLTAAEESGPVSQFPLYGADNITYDGPVAQQVLDAYTSMQQNASTYDRLDLAACLQTYTSRLLVDRRDLLLVTTDQNSTNSILAFYSSEISSEGSDDPINWICSNNPNTDRSSCDPSPFLKDPSSWTVYGHPISYCLSEKAPEPCSVKFSSGIAIAVIICNIIKVSAMFFILWNIDISSTVTCTGDAIASFLSKEDQYTGNMTMASRRDFNKRGWYSGQLSSPPRRWGGAASRGRWCTTIFIMILAIVVVVIVLAAALSSASIKGYSTSISSLWSLGIGTVNPELLAFSDNAGTPATMALLANVPQLILAFIYLVYNAMFRLLFSAQDYALFAFSPQCLMVSTPRGKQRGTWFLGFPFFWAGPMLVLQTFLHWFVSQSFFVVQISVFDEYGVLDNDFASISNCGFSPVSIICAIIVAGVMMIITVGLGFRRLKKGSPPAVGNCSAAVAAACHPPLRSERMQYRKLTWTSRSWGSGVFQGFLTPTEP
ncbi:uncharacterized protein LY89DRAFT_98157 [Mollisia scopiformis]|uniref:DUF6536 domain-containing protein n=1 Tax=Mollisia scopiformis TaxID=149040 RepID=A0A194X6U0_MOLSC|nr:uncharacterized protein LY89DRAFT_98157 [Mollisia scopiformis]KUJ15888.1 hypothetical protein LY89DRAFT_98157 [Mollisia scopiformis]